MNRRTQSVLLRPTTATDRAATERAVRELRDVGLALFDADDIDRLPARIAAADLQAATAASSGSRDEARAEGRQLRRRLLAAAASASARAATLVPPLDAWTAAASRREIDELSGSLLGGSDDPEGI